MQIQPTVAAGSAAGSVSQASSKDRASAATSAESTTPSPQTALEKVAQSEQSSSDRDAEGALYGRANKQNAKDGKPNRTAEEPPHSGLPVKEPEPPSQLDIVG
jgi:hypothetical protein